MSNGLETELNTYRTIQKEIGKVQQQISTAGTQILENEMVLKELDILEEDSSVFKLIGPVRTARKEHARAAVRTAAA
jgi:prefoldin beta subunit